jgi:C4-type Zn-finger protein
MYIHKLRVVYMEFTPKYPCPKCARKMHVETVTFTGDTSYDTYEGIALVCQGCGYVIEDWNIENQVESYYVDEILDVIEGYKIYKLSKGTNDICDNCNDCDNLTC